MTTPEEVLSFWLHEKGPADWYAGGAALDAEIRTRFAPALAQAVEGRLSHWQGNAEGALAFLLLTDQFSRNMYRGTADAYASDGIALAAAARSLFKGFDLLIPPPQRQFFYLPFMHSESMPHQERAVRMILLRMPEDSPNLLHARAHREVIRRFGRFPYRNAHLGRRTTPQEQEFLDAGSYGALVKEMEKTAA